VRVAVAAYEATWSEQAALSRTDTSDTCGLS
jgi:hypothetical protein